MRKTVDHRPHSLLASPSRLARARSSSLLLGVAALAVSCGDQEHAADGHQVYFVGYLYDGATGARLKPEQITALSIKYRDKIIHASLEADGRFATTEPLPTWQDYAVYVGAPGYRPFVSRNGGVDVPRSLSMTDGLATTATTQTFHYDAHLFPAALKAPKVAISIEKMDAATSPAPLARAAGTIRLRPESSSVLERGTLPEAGSPPAGSAPGAAAARRWLNDEDLLNRAVTRPFMDGHVEIGEGELAYGVPYQIAVFDVKGYQPLVLSGSQALLAGAVTSRSIALPRELREPLRVLSTSADSCVPPSGTTSEYAAAIQVVFNEPVELVGSTWAEDVDNGVSVQPAGGSASGTTSYCPLRTSVDPTRQERGTRVTVEGNVLTFSFNPAAGFSPISAFGTTCIVPPALAAVVYGRLNLIALRPTGDPARRRTLDVMLGEHASSSSPALGGTASALSCPAGRSTPGTL